MSEISTPGNEHRSSNPMKNREPAAVTAFFETLTSAVSKLNNRLQQQYEQAYPDLGDIIRCVIDEEEANAWNLLSLFPHLVLPEMVEAHMAQLGLQVVAGRPDNVLAPRAFVAIQKSPTGQLDNFYEPLRSAAVSDSPVHRCSHLC